jgi:hypothetical protein
MAHAEEVTAGQRGLDVPVCEPGGEQIAASLK